MNPFESPKTENTAAPRPEMAVPEWRIKLTKIGALECLLGVVAAIGGAIVLINPHTSWSLSGSPFATPVAAGHVVLGVFSLGAGVTLFRGADRNQLFLQIAPGLILAWRLFGPALLRSL